MKKTLFFLLILFGVLRAQEINFGILVETSAYLTKSYFDNNYGSKTDIYPFSVFASLSIENEESFVRSEAGIVFAGEDFSGFEFGIFYFQNILNRKIYIGSGFNAHYNWGEGHGIGGSKTIFNDLFFQIPIILNFKTTGKIDFLISTVLPLSTNYGYLNVYDENKLKYDKYNIKLNGILKIGMLIKL